VSIQTLNDRDDTIISRLSTLLRRASASFRMRVWYLGGKAYFFESIRRSGLRRRTCWSGQRRGQRAVIQHSACAACSTRRPSQCRCSALLVLTCTWSSSIAEFARQNRCAGIVDSGKGMRR
jgi:hypothetical protein